MKISEQISKCLGSLTTAQSQLLVWSEHKLALVKWLENWSDLHSKTDYCLEEGIDRIVSSLIAKSILRDINPKKLDEDTMVHLSFLQAEWLISELSAESYFQSYAYLLIKIFGQDYELYRSVHRIRHSSNHELLSYLTYSLKYR